ncbi:MAG: ribosomal protein L13e [Thermoproteota archaeon]|nr:ribosomal protein L13e [Candidatus Brockarchaeota archaeon]MBO3767824.1 ribosomal protein L13e [Candidatus Brockarchaeota archaeon]MBO3801134.1 ribosomal protein L13e [Candidatus Brockarchaeota archaeon]
MKDELVPLVKSPITKKLREGKGFSIGELRQAGVTFELAKKLGIRIDRRRKSIREENVKTLKEAKDAYTKTKAT